MLGVYPGDYPALNKSSERGDGSGLHVQIESVSNPAKSLVYMLGESGEQE